MTVIGTVLGRYAIGAALPLAVASAVLTAPAAQAATVYTLAEVHQHATAADCWSAVNGSVYNLTAWIPRHPGGAGVITAMCGLDGSASYNGQHPGGGDENDPAQALARYRIGALDPTPPPPPTTVYTFTDVAAHGTASSCWSIVSGGVYDLTSWIPQHPGGASFITAMCGHDATGSFQGKHSASPGANSALAQFKIGVLDGSSPPAPTPTPIGTYTLAQVATHAIASDCWSAVSGSVYDLTAWIPQHPGGASFITAMCGHDSTASFQGKHSASPGANTALAQYRIGTLSSSPIPPTTPNGTYTLAQVAAHGSATDCWSIVAGSVYDLTSWIPQHPGGASFITAMCGHDSTASFQGKHSASPGANTALGLLRIGTFDASSVPAPTNGSYTMAQVATHNTAGDCWSAVGSSVYALSAWIPQHPGGQGPIVAMCGVDASAAFTGKHAGSTGANSALAQYRIGSLIASVAVLPNGNYSLAEVATHTTASDCWSVVNGAVYNLTAWIPQHPGGQGPIVAMCGVDATAAFTGKHAGSTGANSALAHYRIGTLVGTGAAGATAPTTSTAAVPKARTFTFKQVARHRTVGNCWTVVSHNVYNLTPWTKAHPGRKAAIRHMCGRNATTSYVAGHGGAAHSASILHRYLIGSLGRVASPAAAPSTPAPAVTKYTLADVAAHGTPAACWSAVSGSVYDLTAWIPQHPGGQSAIKSMCGVDGTAAFNGMHSSSASAHTALAKFKIGSLG